MLRPYRSRVLSDSACEVERLAGPARDDQAEGPVVVLVEVVVGDGLVDRLACPALIASRSLARRSSRSGEDLGAELEVVDLDPVHLGHVHVVAVGEERVGVERLAEEAGGAPLADDVRSPAAGGAASRTAASARSAACSRMMLRAEVGEVLRAGRLELARRADLVGRVAGHHLVDGGRVVEQAVGRVAHRPDERELVGDLRRAWAGSR